MKEGNGAADAKPSQTLAIGEVVADKYRIERLLGSGGMAEVYAAINIRTDRRVALKWILPALAASPEVLARFRREALAAGRINHPNVVTIFDVVEHQGSACLVMELLSGETLADRMKRTGPMAFVEAVAIMLPAMRGVAAAHAHGVIHRDLKPDNIFLCMDADGSIRDCKVLDFGVSKLTVADAATTGDITLSGNVVGTPEYMAPEQVRAGKHADHRIDIYSLGVVFYEMLAGRPPFVGEHFSGLDAGHHAARSAAAVQPAHGRSAPAGGRDPPGACARSRAALCRHAVVHHRGRGGRPGRAEAGDGDAGRRADHADRDAAADAGRPVLRPQGSARRCRSASRSAWAPSSPWACCSGWTGAGRLGSEAAVRRRQPPVAPCRRAPAAGSSSRRRASAPAPEAAPPTAAEAPAAEAPAAVETPRSERGEAASRRPRHSSSHQRARQPLAGGRPRRCRRAIRRRRSSPPEAHEPVESEEPSW